METKKKAFSRATYLGKNYDNHASFFDLDQEFCLKITRYVGNIYTGPLLDNGPLFVEKASPMKKEERRKHVLICHPKDAVISELMVELLQPIRRPFFRPI
jgi:hypothetical protein